jgi:glycosyltransferase involved in cell wall biosynthesis
MILFFDARAIRTDFHDGLSRYTTELANAVAEQASDVTFLISDDVQAKFLPIGANVIRIHPNTSIKEPFTALLLNKFRPDVVYSPLQTIGSFGRRFKLILTQQDMTYYRMPAAPRQFKPHIRAAWWLYHQCYWPGRLTLNAADVVTTVSNSSAADIAEAKLTKRPVIVVHNAARDLAIYLDKPLAQQTKPPRNLVYMGVFFAHKNVETLVATAKLLPDYTLHLLSPIKPERRRELEAVGTKNVVFHNGVSDEKYAELLADNAIFLSASKSEGFGLPLAESLALGVPCVVSDIPAHHEVAGQGALYAEATNAEDFVAKITSLDDVTARRDLTAHGQKHVAKFSWHNSAKTLLDACQKLV